MTNYTNTVFYVGITNNIERRVYEHKHGINENAFTKKYRLYKLIWFEEFPSALEAISIEKKIKGWTRIKKIELIKKLNPEWRDLMETKEA